MTNGTSVIHDNVFFNNKAMLQINVKPNHDISFRHWVIIIVDRNLIVE
jgi:hypothetical protein